MNRIFSRIASYVAHQSGRPIAFLLAALVIICWALTGSTFNYSDTWQLVINTGTTIVTFLMVFIIQNTQNRDGGALQAKLDDLILTSHAHNRFIGIEHLTDEEIEEYRHSCATLAKKAAARATARAKDQSHQRP
jgi:low affinity Fe/Cu permease